MFRSASFVLLLGLTVSSFGLGKSDKDAVRDASNKMANAMKSKDLNTLTSLTTSDFTVIENGKTIGRAKWIELTKQTLNLAKISTLSHTIQSVTVSGDQATLKTTTSVTGSATVEGKNKSLSDVSIDKEIWVKQKGSWKFKKDVTISETTKIDGKVQKPPM